MTEKEKVAYMLKTYNGIGVNESASKFDAMKKAVSLEDAYRRNGKIIHVVSIIENVKWREKYKVYQYQIHIDYEVIE